MFVIKKEGVILEKTNLEFENQAVLNPAIIKVGNEVHMFYRAVKKGNYSSIGYAKLKGPLEVVERSTEPILVPEHDYEKHGIEDPRIVWFEEDQLYYLFYTAYDGQNARGAYAISKDLKTFEKKGLITPSIPYDKAEQFFGHRILGDKYYLFEKLYYPEKEKRMLLWEKDVFLLPKKINGKYALIHRILPEIQIIYFDSFEDLKDEHFWQDYLGHLSDCIVLKSKFKHESRNVGGGAPFIDLNEGYLVIYHAVEKMSKGNIYHAAAALLHKDDPTKMIGKLENPLFSPEEPWEKKGDVCNVVFPTGTAIFDDILYIYYGAADSKIAVASVKHHDLLEELI